MSGFISDAISSVSNAASSAVNSLTTNLGSNTTGAIPLTPKDIANVAPEYVVTFTGTDETGMKIGFDGSGVITASMPEAFDINTSAEFAPLFPSADIGRFLQYGPLVSEIGSKAAGVSLQLPLFTQQLWVQSAPLSFTLNLQFNAVHNAKAEVTGNIQSLLLLTLPSMDNIGTLRAVGPTLSPASKYNITMAVGKMALFSNVIIHDVNATIDTMATSKGDYISANVQVRVSTSTVYTKELLSQAFGNQKQTTQAGAASLSSIGNVLSNFAGTVGNL
jgi:hypothetical protein